MPVIDTHNIYKRYGDLAAVRLFRWEYRANRSQLQARLADFIYVINQTRA